MTVDCVWENGTGAELVLLRRRRVVDSGLVEHMFAEVK